MKCIQVTNVNDSSQNISIFYDFREAQITNKFRKYM